MPSDKVVFVPIEDGLPSKPIDWLVEGYVELSATTVFYGYSGTLKSFLLLHLALCVVTGRPFFGQPVRRGTVLFIAGEGRRGLKRRVQAWERHYGALTEAERALLVCPVRGDRSLSMQVLNGKDGSVGEPLRAVVHAIKAMPVAPVAVIFDTVATTFGLAEETNEQISRALSVLHAQLSEPFNCSVIASHHTGKDGSRGPRGGYSMVGDADAIYLVRRADGPANAPPSTPFDCSLHTINVINVKMKDEVAPPDLSISAERVVLSSNGTGDVSSLVIVSPDMPPRRKAVLDGLRDGLSLKDIAFTAGCSYGTVVNERDALVTAGLWALDQGRPHGRPRVEHAD